MGPRPRAVPAVPASAVSLFAHARAWRGPRVTTLVTVPDDPCDAPVTPLVKSPVTILMTLRDDPRNYTDDP